MDDERAEQIAYDIYGLNIGELDGLVLAVQKGYAVGIIESWEKS